MADKAREWTDKELARMEKKIDKTYKQASKELNKKWDAYMKRGEDRVSALQNAYSEALKSGDRQSIADAKNSLESAMKSFTLQNDQYKAMVESVTLDMAQVNQKALSYINDQLPNVYAENHDQVKVDLNNVKVDYTLADKGTVKRMIKDGDIKLPKKKISVPKDVAWNTKKINSSVLQGILQGESMDKIAKRLLPIMDSNRTSAIRNARTLVTGAENRGRIDSYHELADQGIIIKKVWIATGDDRTRDAHLVMDGQEVDIDENFVDGDGNELEYPADPSGEPATVYNCRCSMRTHIVGVQNEDGTIDYIDYEHDEGLHQEQIEEEIERRNQEEPTEPIELIEPQEVVEEPKQNAYEYIGEPLSRPRASDYGGYTEEYEQAKNEYRANREARSERAEKWYNENINTEPMQIKELQEWCKNNDCVIYGSLDGLDGITLRNYTERYEKLSNDFPLVKEFHDKIGRPFEIAYDPNAIFDAEATHGMTFGKTYSDFHQTFTNSVISSDGIGFVMGENPAVRTFDHEFGHQIYDALKYGKDEIPFDSTMEELNRRKEMKDDLIKSVYGKNGMSEYATTNDDELFAEAFCSWYGGEKTEFANAFGEFLNRWM